MTTVVRRASESDGMHPARSFDLEATINEIEEELSELAARAEDTEWVVDLQSGRVVRRTAGLARRQR